MINKNARQFYQFGLSSLLLVLMLSLLLELVLFSVLMVSRLGFQRSVRFDRSRQAFVAAEGVMQDTLLILRKQDGWPDNLAKTQTFKLGQVDVSRTIAADAQNTHFSVEIQTEVEQARRKLTAEYEVTEESQIGEDSQRKVPVDVMLILDASGSMAGTIGKMKEAAVELINSETFNEVDRIGLVSLSTRGTLISPLTNDKTSLVQKVNALVAQNQTNITESLLKASLELDQRGRAEAQKYVILFTDGVPSISWRSNTDMPQCSDSVCSHPGSNYRPNSEGTKCSDDAIIVGDNVRRKYELYGIYFKISKQTCTDLGRMTVQAIVGPDQTKYFEMTDILFLKQIFETIGGEIVEKKGGTFTYQEVEPGE